MHLRLLSTYLSLTREVGKWVSRRSRDDRCTRHGARHPHETPDISERAISSLVQALLWFWLSEQHSTAHLLKLPCTKGLGDWNYVCTM